MSLTRGNGGSASYGYDAAGRLDSLTQAGAPAYSAKSSIQTISYTPASQIASLAQSQLDYVWKERPTFANDTHNGQNQIARFVALGGYDRNGNTTKIGDAVGVTRIYDYDAENRLTAARTPAGAPILDLSYDPTGRLRATKSASGTWTYFLYAGDQLIGEYAAAPSGSQPPLRRYVHADGVDEPVVWYEETGGGGRSWLHADRQGSIIATSNAAGEVTTYAYGPWGETTSWSGPRFRYTGQAALPEIQSYHYKARVYEPVLGRFLQTDPIGQKDDPNLYLYVKGDPANLSDPTGLVSINMHLENKRGIGPDGGWWKIAQAFNPPGYFTVAGHGRPGAVVDSRGGPKIEYPGGTFARENHSLLTMMFFSCWGGRKVQMVQQ